MQIIYYLILLLGLLILRIPIIVATGIVTFVYIIVATSMPLVYVPTVVFQSLNQFTLLAIPLFIMAGSFMSAGGIAKHLLNLADKIVGSFPGGIALTTIVACVFIADLTGSGPATVAAIGSITIPAMIKRGYDPGFACAVAACAGTLGVIIPPSNPMIIYGVSGDVSIGKLFFAGFLPGIMLAVSMMIPVYIISKKRGYKGSEKCSSLLELGSAIWQAKWALLVPVIILGGIYSGIFTPTESAAVACIYAFIIGMFVYKDFKLSDMPRIMGRTLLLNGAILPIIAFATAFGQVITLDGIPQALAISVSQNISELWVLLLILNGLLLLVGCFMEALAGIVLLTPLLLPMVQKFGMDPVHFGIVLIVNLAIGFMTPPLGLNLFVAQSIANVKIASIFKSAVPIIISMLICLGLITYIPIISLLIPNMFFGK
jgi:C4-dicarboxylate transporter DctM subunit